MALALGTLVAAGLPAGSGEPWRPAGGRILTRWAKEVSPERVLPEYPRPQMVRERWLNLNGLWDCAIRPRTEGRPGRFDGKILVPFPAESALSGLGRRVGEGERLWYRRTFLIPEDWRASRIRLHFGAVDWEASVWLNGTELGTHRGGYDPFTLEATSAARPGEENELVVSVWDPTDAGGQPRGKQARRPEGIWYTPVTGIWQTVWAEPVPRAFIEKLAITPDVDAGLARVTVHASGAGAAHTVELAAMDGARRVASSTGRPLDELELRFMGAKLWFPESPFLYDLSVTLYEGRTVVDSVKSYLGMRKSSVGKDASGITRLLLNDRFVFQLGLLDQGWWPDGLYTAPADEALRYDIEAAKRLGFNMLRKHVKVEPERFYYWCDRLGMVVWQDMPNGNNSSEEARAQFELELARMVDSLRNHPSVVMWVPFNEGWGQYDTERIVRLVKERDPSRPVDNASGWTDCGVGDVRDVHVYPGPGMAEPEELRASVLGEFGGLGLPVRGHSWQEDRNWGYRSHESREALTNDYVGLVGRLRWLVGRGLSAAVYTQTTDVETEVNGLMTYDRAIVKMDEARVAEANRRAGLPPPQVRVLVPTSEGEPSEWRWSTDVRGDDWRREDFNDSSWRRGQAGFGARGTPGAVVRTEWRTPEIWLRRTFELRRTNLAGLALLAHHDEDAEVWLNGRQVARLPGYTTAYEVFPLGAEALEAIKPGRNVLAVHCRQTGGGQYIDVGLIELVETPRP